MIRAGNAGGPDTGDGSGDREQSPESGCLLEVELTRGRRVRCESRGKSGRLSSSGLPQRAAGPGTEVWTARL